MIFAAAFLMLGGIGFMFVGVLEALIYFGLVTWISSTFNYTER